MAVAGNLRESPKSTTLLGAIPALVSEAHLRLAEASPAVPLRHPRGQALQPYVAPERLFDALDGHDVSLPEGQWRIEVFSVADFCNARWVQLALVGGARFMLTLRLASGDGVAHVVQSVVRWVGKPAGFSRRLTAA